MTGSESKSKRRSAASQAPTRDDGGREQQGRQQGAEMQTGKDKEEIVGTIIPAVNGRKAIDVEKH